MKNKHINSYQATAVLVKVFFEAFAMGILDSLYRGDRTKEKYKAQNIKQALLEHYGIISQHFFTIVFPMLVRLNYLDAAKAQAQLEQRFRDTEPTMQDYLRFACKTPRLYQAMVDEYKRNFSFLLQGRLATAAEHLQSYTRGSRLAMVSEPLAISMLVRTLLQAYTTGIRVSATSKASLHQPSIIRLVLVNVSLLVNDSQPGGADDNPEALLMQACGNNTDNLNVLLNTLNETYEQLANEAGIISTNDRAN